MRVINFIQKYTCGYRVCVKTLHEQAFKREWNYCTSRIYQRNMNNRLGKQWAPVEKLNFIFKYMFSMFLSLFFGVRLMFLSTECLNLWLTLRLSADVREQDVGWILKHLSYVMPRFLLYLSSTFVLKPQREYWIDFSMRKLRWSDFDMRCHSTLSLTSNFTLVFTMKILKSTPAGSTSEVLKCLHIFEL